MVVDKLADRLTKEPLISDAICADPDSTPLDANKDPVKLPEKEDPVNLFPNTAWVVVNDPLWLILPVKVCVSSSELPNTLLPEANWIDELTNTVSYWLAIKVPLTIKLPEYSPEPDTDKWFVAKLYWKLSDEVKNEDEILFDPDLICMLYWLPTAWGK